MKKKTLSKPKDPEPEVPTVHPPECTCGCQRYNHEVSQTITSKENLLKCLEAGVIYTGLDLGFQEIQVMYRKEHAIPYGGLLRAIEKQFPGATKKWDCRPVPKELNGVKPFKE